MERLKGKKIMVWTFMGNARMYEALEKYGDRIDTVGLFSFKVRATGEMCHHQQYAPLHQLVSPHQMATDHCQ